MPGSRGSRPSHNASADAHSTSIAADARPLPDELPADLAPEQQATISIAPPSLPPPLIGAQPRLLPERSRSIRASVYRQGARVSYDPALQALSLEFILWPLHSAEDIALAFGTLLPRVNAIIARRDHHRLPLLIDLAGFEATDAHHADAQQALTDLIAEICVECAPSCPLAVRYDSRRTPAPRQRAAAVKHIEKLPSPHPDALLALLATPLASCDEAAALLLRLLALSPSAPR